MILKAKLFGQVYEFKDVKDVMNKAAELKSGDQLAGIAAETMQERIAAKECLAKLTVKDIYENPVCPYEEDDGFDPNETPDKYGIKDFLEGKAFYGRSGEDETGMMMQIVSTLHERVDENTCISLSLARYNKRLGDMI